MKRFIAVLMLLVLVASSAFADDFNFSSFSIYSQVLGATGIDVEKDSVMTNENAVYHVFNSDDCQIVFISLDGAPSIISIKGSGDAFLAYSCAAIQILDPTGEKVPGYGNILACYLMTVANGERHIGFTSSGYAFEIEKTETGYSFLGGV